MNMDNIISVAGTPQCEPLLKKTIEGLTGDQLPLQQGLTQGGYALDVPLSAMMLKFQEEADHIEAKLGLFYTGVVSGCCCSDDPTPTDITTEYCTIAVSINKATAIATITLVED